MRCSIIFYTLLFSSLLTLAQSTGYYSGKVTNSEDNPVAKVIVYVNELSTETDSLGTFKLEVPSNITLSSTFIHPKYHLIGENFIVKTGESKSTVVKLLEKDDDIEINTVEIEGTRDRTKATEVEIDTRDIKGTVGVSGDGLEFMKMQNGVISNNELSSAYNVRGGSFDENLIYVNGIQVYRPFLVRSGQQEGLSFVNGDMIKNITFSAGGFDAKYGDKLSSVLSINYLDPDSFSAGVNLSFLGARFFVADKIGKFSYIMGGRYKSNSYLLGTLETDGEYRPEFYDYQTFLNYQANKKLKFGFLGNISLNKYQSVPVSRKTKFGGINNAFQLSVNFNGQEIDRFQTYFSALTADYKVSDSTNLKFTFSAFSTIEEETFDIFGSYSLNELETNFGNEEFGTEGSLLGTGAFLDHSRNFLTANILNAEHKGKTLWKNGSFLWGAKYQHEEINDELLEWKYKDSADYNVPLGSDGELKFAEYTKTNTTLITNRISAYLQNNWKFFEKEGAHQLFLNTGIRANYWDYNDQLVVSPRVSLTYAPSDVIVDSLGFRRDSSVFTYRLAWGYYYQPPFYRELRNLDGQIMKGVLAQKSIHYVAGVDYDFYAWKRPFTWKTEAYYKDLSDVIPFNVDNVRIRYYGENSAKAYAYGLETRINGEFIKGLESWLSIAYMKTEEDISNDDYYEYYNASGEKIVNGFTFDQIATDSVSFNRGYMPRATDQRVSFKIYFQDEMPSLPAFKVHLNLVFATGMPFGNPESARDRNTLRIPAYRRADIGFSYQFVKNGLLQKKTGNVPISKRSALRHFENFTVKMDVFNLLNIANTVSYLWVSDINNRSYAVPNFLTQRLINLRLNATF